MNDRAAPAFDDREGGLERRQFVQGNEERSRRQTIERLPDESRRLARFLYPH